ncbi:MAG: TIGR04086 family membrane protein [Clostridia bacterium]|nr:TIGR04086 family membrane protein [Clostridia bacterium]
MENTKNIEIESKEKIIRIAKSIIFSVVFTLILLFAYSILLSYSSISETTIPIAIIAISSISILTFSIICMLKIKNNGIINGGIIGLFYMLIIYLLSSIVQTGFGLNLNSIIMIISGVICGMLGGIIGVNIK